jgi:hypothetical protein
LSRLPWKGRFLCFLKPFIFVGLLHTQ